MLKNVEVAIEDEINSIKFMVNEQNCKLVRFRKRKSQAFYKIDAMLYFVYMSTSLDVKNKRYEKVNKKKFDLLELGYYDIKQD